LEVRVGVTLVGAKNADEHLTSGAVPLMLDPTGKPVKRNFVHVSDLVEGILRALDHPQARQQTFNICMDEPVDYQQVADYLRQTRGIPAVEIKDSVSVHLARQYQSEISARLEATL